METGRTILREGDRVSVSWTVPCNNHYVDSHYFSLINEVKSPVLKDLQHWKGIKKNNKNLTWLYRTGRLDNIKVVLKVIELMNIMSYMMFLKQYYTCSNFLDNFYDRSWLLAVGCLQILTHILFRKTEKWARFQSHLRWKESIKNVCLTPIHIFLNTNLSRNQIKLYTLLYRDAYSCDKL